MVSYKDQLKILASGAKEVIDYDSLERRLYESEKSGIPLNVKLGADPTAPSLHIGHMVPVHKLKQFQDLGHKTYFLMGDFTARIGDPTGKSSKRVGLTKAGVDGFVKDYSAQIFKILDPNKTNVVFNSNWFENMNVYEFITEIAPKYTLAQLLARDDFKTRYSNNIPIAISEFLYPLLQGYDSVKLNADVEVGGNDQLFNFMVARELQKQFGQKPECLITLPTIRGLDGSEKMSKSLGNSVNVRDSPVDMFGKIMSIDDGMMVEYMRAFGFRDLDYISQVESGVIHPKLAKESLASYLTEVYHSEKDAVYAREDFQKKFVNKGCPEQMEHLQLSYQGDIPVIDLFFKAGLAPSKSEVRRLVKQKGLRVNGVTVEDENQRYALGTYILSVGKRRFTRVSLNDEQN